jgi:hypothetical protein
MSEREPPCPHAPRHYIGNNNLHTTLWWGEFHKLLHNPRWVSSRGSLAHTPHGLSPRIKAAFFEIENKVKEVSSQVDELKEAIAKMKSS